MDYFVVEDTPQKPADRRTDRHKQTAHTQDTLGRLSSSRERDREDSPGSLGSVGKPQVDAFDSAGEYSVRLPDNDFVSFYDENELPGPKQSVLPKQSAVPSLKKSEVKAPQPEWRAKKPQFGQRNTFFESQEDSREADEASSPDKSPTEKKRTNQFVSELVDEAARRSPESKKESVIINHIIKRDEEQPSAGFFLLKLADAQQEPEEAPTSLRTPRRSIE